MSLTINPSKSLMAAMLAEARFGARVWFMPIKKNE